MNVPNLSPTLTRQRVLLIMLYNKDQINRRLEFLNKNITIGVHILRVMTPNKRYVRVHGIVEIAQEFGDR